MIVSNDCDFAPHIGTGVGKGGNCSAISEAYFVGADTEDEPFRKVSKVAAAVFAWRERVLRDTSKFAKLIFCVPSIAVEGEALIGFDPIGSDCSVGSNSDDFCAKFLAWLGDKPVPENVLFW